MDDLKRNLGDVLAERIRERRERARRQALKPRAGWRRIDIKI